MKKNNFYAIITIAVFVIAIIMFFVSRNYNLFSPSENIGENINIPSKIVLPGDDEKIFSSINGEQDSSVTVFPNLSPERVKELLSHIKTPDSFCWYYNHSLLSSKRTISEFGVAKFDVGSYKIEIYNENSILKKTIIEDNGTVSVSKDGSSTEFLSLFTDAFKEAGVPSLLDFTETPIQDFTYSLIESEYGTLLYAEFVNKKDAYSQTEQYYISLDYGIVVRADCYENDNLIYSLKTNALYEIESSIP